MVSTHHIHIPADSATAAKGRLAAGTEAVSRYLEDTSWARMVGKNVKLTWPATDLVRLETARKRNCLKPIRNVLDLYGKFGIVRSRLETRGNVRNHSKSFGTIRSCSERFGTCWIRWEPFRIAFLRSMAPHGTVRNHSGSFGIIQLFGSVHTAWDF